ncbi:cache domain-containing protein [Octadecabacter sp. 1_MG-2023]|uniref:cache domain-containing protein n=1 Tax=unclassified Octadecabacter TaxID=196158 RepID=UPI001C08104E|nr:MULTISPECIES: cache domain-containing protein [unclassified Octadecabacter]MBU2993657.1 cache domain-containing protein [Octadecabacter sp. B2R22]MDO6735499.1 cache domain-containing protein [Octadecabacter sp. 1_MG-2023]
MRSLFSNLRQRLSPNYGQKLFLLATVPLLLCVTIITLIVAGQSRQLAEREIRALETQLIDAKRAELQNYMSLARTAFVNIYGRAAPDDEQAKLEVTRILSAMIYGQDGYFFVFDYEGNNLVAPRQTDLIGENWLGLQDQNGVMITDEIVRLARSGGGYHEIDWLKPSTGEAAPMIVIVSGLQDWRWAIGTGIFIDDVLETVAAARADVEARIQQTTFYILLVTIAALIIVFGSGMMFNIRERRLADAKLKQLTERIIDTQEEERSRVARELHDGISQILVSVRYALELARRRLTTGDARAGESLDKGIDSLGGAIQEVRRISRDLRPGVLDDLGLGPALQSLTSEFSTRTGINVDFETVVFRGRLDEEGRIALYRVAQEALTNIERHAGASEVALSLTGSRKGAVMRISDNGRGIPQGRSSNPGLGLRNMAERMEQLDGSLDITSSRTGTTILAMIPLSHMLRPTTATTTDTGQTPT